jgi:xanthine dehydrogenase YagS FAD-binding subunit
MKSFYHVDAKTVTEAVKLFKDNRGTAKLIAGGTDLLSILKDKILPAYPETIINIKIIPNLNQISEDAGGLKIGTLAKLEEIAQSPVVKEKHKLLANAAQAALDDAVPLGKNSYKVTIARELVRVPFYRLNVLGK